MNKVIEWVIQNRKDKMADKDRFTNLKTDIEAIRNTVWPEEIGKALFRVCDAAEAAQSPPPASDEVREAIAFNDHDIKECEFILRNEIEPDVRASAEKSLKCLKVIQASLQAATPQAGRSEEAGNTLEGYTPCEDFEGRVVTAIREELCDMGLIDQYRNRNGFEEKRCMSIWIQERLTSEGFLKYPATTLQPPPAPVTEDEAGKALIQWNSLTASKGRVNALAPWASETITRALQHFAKKAGDK